MKQGGARAWATRWAASWAGRASWAGLLLRALAGLAGCCALAGRAGRACYGPSFLLFLFLFYFSSPLFEFKFGLKFEFQIGAPYSLEFLDMRPTTFFYMCILGIYLAILYNKNRCSFVIQKIELVLSLNLYSLV